MQNIPIHDVEIFIHEVVMDYTFHTLCQPVNRNMLDMQLAKVYKGVVIDAQHKGPNKVETKKHGAKLVQWIVRTRDMILVSPTGDLNTGLMPLWSSEGNLQGRAMKTRC